MATRTLPVADVPQFFIDGRRRGGSWSPHCCADAAAAPHGAHIDLQLYIYMLPTTRCACPSGRAPPPPVHPSCIFRLCPLRYQVLMVADATYSLRVPVWASLVRSIGAACAVGDVGDAGDAVASPSTAGNSNLPAAPAAPAARRRFAGESAGKSMGRGAGKGAGNRAAASAACSAAAAASCECFSPPGRARAVRRWKQPYIYLFRVNPRSRYVYINIYIIYIYIYIYILFQNLLYQII